LANEIIHFTMSKIKLAENAMDRLVNLCARRGFIFPGSATYGGFANTWDYGPLGEWIIQ